MKDQTELEDRTDILVYTSPPFEKATTLAGPVQVHLFAATDGPDTDFTAKLVLVGSAYQLNEDYSLAFSFLEQALQKDENLAASYYQYARTGVLTKKNVDQSIAYMQQFLSLKDKASYPPASAYWRLGMLYEIKAQQKKAREAYQKGLSLDPKHKQLQKAMAQLKQ